MTAGRARQRHRDAAAEQLGARTANGTAMTVASFDISLIELIRSLLARPER